ncbi:hypothetical protein QYF36_024858 [Acer negundo]|nr:hypothetical protein QYF36_024858 [Acer negundo]
MSSKFEHNRSEFPNEVLHLPFLQKLILSENIGLTGQFPDVFRNLRKVKYLDLSQNNFSGQLPLSAFNLTQLSSLDFSDNQLVGQFPSQTSGLSYLTKLRLFNNLLNGKIPPWLFTLPSLEILGLGYNNFTGSLDQSQALAGSLKKAVQKGDKNESKTQKKLISKCMQILKS